MVPFFMTIKYCMKIQITTLIDITQTNIRNKFEDKKQFHQQSNYNSVVQTASLKANVIPTSCEQKEGGITTFNFGTLFKNRQKYWIITFDNEYDDSITEEILLNDFDLVPIILNLNETAKITEPVFRTKDSQHKNIVFKILPN